jgi:putative hemolysin
MPIVPAQILLILALILANGLFSMAEMALVSARKARLQQKADDGDKRAQVALDLASKPSQLLSMVQIGITLIGILIGALSGAEIADGLSGLFALVPFLRPLAHPLALVLVVIVITFISLVLGELVPKRLALNSPEKIALAFAIPMQTVARIAKPFVHILSGTTEAVVRLMGIKLSTEPSITEEEFHVLLEQGTEAGVFEEAEQDMVESVLTLGDRRVSSLMTPRHEIVWLDPEDLTAEITQKILTSGYSRFPVAHESLDSILGEVNAKDLLIRSLNGLPFDLKASLCRPLYVPEVMPVLAVLEQFRQEETQMALVVDEYGSLTGLITLNDILEMIVGELPSTETGDDPDAVQREDGSWLLDGMVPIDDLKELLHLEELPGEDQGLFNTLAGFITTFLGRMPAVADHFTWEGQRFEVVDMDGNRIDRVLIAQMPDPEVTEGTQADT